jgi:cysteine desulfurase
MAIQGYVSANKHKGNHIITSSIEHPSVTSAMKQLEKDGYNVTYLNPDSQGFIDPELLARSITPQTILVSIIHANNEIGTIQDIEKLGLVCSKHNIAFHIDAVQSFLKISIPLSNVSMMSCSGHKIHAPKGIGFLYKKKSVQIDPLIHGGGQEFKLRAGTENSPYIVGLARAIELFDSREIEHIKYLQSYLIFLLRQLPNIRLNGPEDLARRIPNNVNFSARHFEGEKLLIELNRRGICVSTGSACSSKSTKISPVLKAIKCPTDYIHGNLRISLSKYNTKEEIDYFIVALSDILTADTNPSLRMREINRVAAV